MGDDIFNKDSITRSQKQARSAWYYDKMQQLLKDENFIGIYELLAESVDKQASLHFQRMQAFRK